MISLSTTALEQIRHSADTGAMRSIPLRVAVKKMDDGSLHYAMGFDDHKLPGDTFSTSMVSIWWYPPAARISQMV